VVESLDCDTGQLEYRVPVANLLSAPSGSDDYEFPLAIFVYLFFEDGSSYASYTPPYLTYFSPSAGEAPYTGSVSVESVIFVMAPDTASPLESLEFSAFVGNPVPESSVIGNPTDTSTTTHTVDCDDDSLIDGLVAALKRILRGILGS
jgi:hypothetical protein